MFGFDVCHLISCWHFSIPEAENRNNSISSNNNEKVQSFQPSQSTTAKKVLIYEEKFMASDSDSDFGELETRAENSKKLNKEISETVVSVLLNNIVDVEHSLRSINENNIQVKKDKLEKYGYRRATGLLSVCYRPEDRLCSKPAENSKINNKVLVVDGMHRLHALRELIDEGNGTWKGYKLDGYIAVVLFTPSGKEPISHINILGMGRLLNDISSSFFDMSLSDRLWSVMSHVELFRKDNNIGVQPKKCNQSAISRSIHTHNVLGDISYRQVDRHVRVGLRMTSNQALRETILDAAKQHAKIGLEHLSSLQLLDCTNRERIQVMMACIVSLVIREGGPPGAFISYKEKFLDCVNKIVDELERLCEKLSMTIEEVLRAEVEVRKDMSMTGIELIAERMQTFNPLVKDMEKGHKIRINKIVDKISQSEVCQLAKINMISSARAVALSDKVTITDRISELVHIDSDDSNEKRQDGQVDSLKGVECMGSEITVRDETSKRAARKAAKSVRTVSLTNREEDSVEIRRARKSTSQRSSMQDTSRRGDKLATDESSKVGEELEQHTPPSIRGELNRERLESADGTKVWNTAPEKCVDTAGEQSTNWRDWSVKKRADLFRDIGGSLPIEHLKKSIAEVEADVSEENVNKGTKTSPRQPYDDRIPDEGVRKDMERPGNKREELESSNYRVRKLLYELYIPEEHRSNTLLTYKEVEKVIKAVDIIAKSDILIRNRKVHDVLAHSMTVVKENDHYAISAALAYDGNTDVYWCEKRKELELVGYTVIPACVSSEYDEQMKCKIAIGNDSTGERWHEKLRMFVQKSFDQYFDGLEKVMTGTSKAPKDWPYICRLWTKIHNVSVEEDEKWGEQLASRFQNNRSLLVEHCDRQSESIPISKCKAILDVRIGSVMRKLELEHDNRQGRMAMMKTGGRFLIHSKGCPPQRVHTDAPIGTTSEVTDSKYCPGYFVIASGEREIVILIVPHSHRLFAYARSSQLLALSRAVDARKVTIPAFSVLVARADLWHAGAGHGMVVEDNGCLRYHSVLIPTEQTLLDTVNLSALYNPSSCAEKHGEEEGRDDADPPKKRRRTD